MEKAPTVNAANRSLALALTVLGALARLMPHPPNFTPVGGASLFAGARVRGWQAYLVPLLLMAVTDPLLSVLYGFRAYSSLTPFVYGSFLINVWVGRRLRARERPVSIGAAAAICSLQFFLISNFAVWLCSGLYAHNAAGLAACYAAALPFLGRTLAADLLWSAALFGLHAWLSRKRLEGKLLRNARSA
jgi:hypothetical protein